MTAARPLRRVVVTGGAGFLGTHVCGALAAAGAEVVCVDNFATGSREHLAQAAAAAGGGSVTLAEQDVSEGLDVPGEIDAVLHLASAASPPDYLRLGVETLRAGADGTRHALELARARGARFVLASTSEVYGDPLVHPQPEDYWGNVNPVGPRSVYDEAKRYAEALTTAYRGRYGVDTGIVRIFNSYGPRMRAGDGRAVPAFVTAALAGLPLPVAGDGRQTRSLCYVSDTVTGIMAMAAGNVPGPVNIGNPEEMTVLDLAQLVIRLTGTASGIEFIPRPADDPARRCPDITLAREKLGWQPAIPADEGLRRTIAWFAAQPASGAR